MLILCVVQNGHLEAVKFLVANGATNLDRALFEAVEVRVFDIFMSKKKDDTELAYLGFQNDHRKVAEFLIECGANVNFVYRGQSLLFEAVAYQSLDLVELIVANGADVNRKLLLLDGGTVLHRACKVSNFNYFLFFSLDYFR